MNPPILSRLDAHLVALAMLLGKLVALFCQRDIDDALPALILVENDLLVVGTGFEFASQDVGNFNDLVPSDHAVLYRPINIALLRVDGLCF